LVEEIVKAIGASGDEPVPGADGAPKPFRNALKTDYIITTPSKEFIKALVDKGSSSGGVDILRTLSTDPLRKHEFEQYLYGMEFIDFLLNHPSIPWTPEELIKTMRKLQPRLYSIASSMKAVGNNVHLTIATVRYESHGRKRKGVASSFLADRTGPEVPVPVFVHQAKHFRLPEDTNTPVIMVGPGTGVAPFRAFLQERKATGSKGKNWLFFGEQRRSQDFMYEEELMALQQEGVLTKLDIAFSRDVPGQKVYVQHRMRENAKELYQWLEEGAHFYVCGDGARMAKDVDAELIKIAETEGGKSPQEAAEYIEGLKKSKRYKRDVY
jgi:sulfite reductase (NADPH) flavoprotein alpha-component